MEPFFFDREQLTSLAEARAGGWSSAAPFPHAVFDEFLPPWVADALVAEFPRPGDVAWIAYRGEHERKLESPDESVMGAFTRHVVSQLNGAAVIEFLERLTGIAGLVPDPSLWGGGLHQTEPGGHLEIHADFNVHPSTRLHRRLNLIVYLNRPWDEAWGGHLELWDAGMRRCEARVSPVFNRCVVFATDRTSYHGHPHPLATPAGVTRKSLALYYYARDPAEGGVADDHTTLFQTRPAPRSRRSALASRVLPDAVVDALRRRRHGTGEGGVTDAALSRANR